MTIHPRDLGNDRASPVAVPVRAARRQRGALAHRTGLMAEDQVADACRARGMTILARRHRGPGGEIDLIAEDGGCTVFIEVKAAATHAIAAERLDPRQQARIRAAAEAYCGALPDGLLTEMRIDVALVDGTGRITMLRNAIWQD